MADLELYVQQRLEVLQRLQRTATAEELAYYRQVQELYQSLLDSPSEQAAPAGAVPRVQRLSHLVVRLEYELRQPELGTYWHAWASQEAERLRSQLAQLPDGDKVLVQLRETLMLSEGDYQRQDEVEGLETRVEEIDALMGLLQAHQSRSGISAAAEGRLQQLRSEQEQVRRRLEALTSELTTIHPH